MKKVSPSPKKLDMKVADSKKKKRKLSGSSSSGIISKVNLKPGHLSLEKKKELKKTLKTPKTMLTAKKGLPLKETPEQHRGDKVMSHGKGQQQQQTKNRKKKPQKKENQVNVSTGEEAEISLSRVNVLNAVQTLTKKNSEDLSKKPQFLRGASQFLVTINFFKLPQSKSVFRPHLPHSLAWEESDICFFASDLRKSKHDPEESAEFTEELFKKAGVTRVIEILPWRKVKTEYTQFEQKRKLIDRFDFCLIDSRLMHRWQSVLKKCFFKRKSPIPIRMKGDIKRNIENALKKTVLLTSNEGLTVSVLFGHSHMSNNDLAENLYEIINKISPKSLGYGGFQNIRSIFVRTPTNLSLPVYVSTALPNDVQKPKKVKSSKKRPIVGEISTVPGKLVMLDSSGKITLVNEAKLKKKMTKTEQTLKSKTSSKEDESNVEDEDSSNELEDLSDEDEEKFTFGSLQTADETSDEEKDSDDEEKEIELAERQFLSELRAQQNEIEAKSKKDKKLMKKTQNKSQSIKEEDQDDESEMETEEDADSDDESNLFNGDDSDDDEIPKLVAAKPRKFKNKFTKSTKSPPSPATKKGDNKSNTKKAKNKSNSPGKMNSIKKKTKHKGDFPENVNGMEKKAKNKSNSPGKLKDAKLSNKKFRYFSKKMD